jgi:hypothetical protein
MWIPAGVLYAIAGLALVAGWLREGETRSLKQEVVGQKRKQPYVPSMGSLTR